MDIGITVEDRACIETRLSEAIVPSEKLIVATVSTFDAERIDRKSLKDAPLTVVDNYRRSGLGATERAARSR